MPGSISAATILSVVSTELHLNSAISFCARNGHRITETECIVAAHSSKYYLQRPRKFAQNNVLLKSAATREAKLIVASQLLPYLFYYESHGIKS
eukprot:3467323-Prymnesium_polylepis.1